MDQPLQLPDGRVELSDGARLELVPAGDGYASAIVRRDADGSIAWWALPPEGQTDAWVTVRRLGNSLTVSFMVGLVVGHD